MPKALILRCLPALLALVLLAGCARASAPQVVVVETPILRVTPEPLQTIAPEVAATAAASPTSAAEASPTPSAAPPTSTPAPKPVRGALGLEVSAAFTGSAGEQALAALKASGEQTAIVTGESDLQLQPDSAGDALLFWERVYSPVDRMSSVLDSITFDELRCVWSGSAASPNFSNIYVPETALAELETVLGPASDAVKPQPKDGIADAIWGDKMALGIVPFEDLSLRLRAVGLDGVTATDNRFSAEKWPLAARGWLSPTTERGREALAKLDSQHLPITNRDPGKLTVLVMTGVTAMARNSAVAIEKAQDYGFLARLVGPELAAADITIISNEIPIIEGCVADNTLNNLLLCSRPEYYLNLELSGADAIGLTGNHMNDFGFDGFRETLAFYEEKQIPFYAGGADDKSAREPLILEHNGNRLGFLGANQWGPEWYWSKTGEKVSAWAGPDYPGAARFSVEQINADIQALKPKVDLVFAEVQHTEFNAAGNYQVEPIPSQESDFRAMNDAGADVVTGVQAHAPQAMELRGNGAILYGLGNLYFDQTWSWPTRTGLVARHAIYDGRLINTEFLVTVIDPNFQLRWATPEERIQVLKSVFDVSRW